MCEATGRAAETKGHRRDAKAYIRPRGSAPSAVCEWCVLSMCVCDVYSVCVWSIWIDVKLLPNIQFQAGGSGRSFGTATSEDTHLIWWYRLGRQSAYLHHFSIFVNGNRPSPEPACRTIFFSCHFCTVVAIWNYFRSITEDWAASEHWLIYFAQFFTPDHPMSPVRFNWSVFARVMHSTSVIR